MDRVVTVIPAGTGFTVDVTFQVESVDGETELVAASAVHFESARLSLRGYGILPSLCEVLSDGRLRLSFPQGVPSGVYDIDLLGSGWCWHSGKLLESVLETEDGRPLQTTVCLTATVPLSLVGPVPDPYPEPVVRVGKAVWNPIVHRCVPLRPMVGARYVFNSQLKIKIRRDDLRYENEEYGRYLKLPTRLLPVQEGQSPCKYMLVNYVGASGVIHYYDTESLASYSPASDLHYVPGVRRVGSEYIVTEEFFEHRITTLYIVIDLGAAGKDATLLRVSKDMLDDAGWLRIDYVVNGIWNFLQPAPSSESSSANFLIKDGRVWCVAPPPVRLELEDLYHGSVQTRHLHRHSYCGGGYSERRGGRYRIRGRRWANDARAARGRVRVKTVCRGRYVSVYHSYWFVHGKKGLVLPA